MKVKKFSSTELVSVLSSLPSTNHYWLAYSGGMDSTVMLHAISRVSENFGDSKISAVHVHHGISENADAWVDHCQQFCKGLEIDLTVLHVNAQIKNGESPEEKARQLRYQAIQELMKKNDILLTAHHQNDQAETYLLHLLRGSGPRGLSCMPLIREFGCGYIARPLLSFNRKQLADYARQEQLQWINDESNKNIDLDRNYIRNEILPVIEKKWPSAVKTISRSAEHQSELTELLDEFINEDFKNLTSDKKNVLSIDELVKLPVNKAKYILFSWLRNLDYPVPNSRIMENIITQLVNASWDSEACIRWNDAEIRRYRDKIYAMRPLSTHDPDITHTWNVNEPLKVASGILSARKVTGEGIDTTLVRNDIVMVKYRHGGEHIQPYGKAHRCELKKLFQEIGMPPWLRDRIPLIYLEDKLIAVSDLWIDTSFHAKQNHEGWAISLTQ